MYVKGTKDEEKVMSSWLIYAGILIYMEIVFHLGCFGLVGFNPVFPLGLIALIAAIQALISGSLSRRGRHRAFLDHGRIGIFGVFCADSVFQDLPAAFAD